jgi:hypothetical protein
VQPQRSRHCSQVLSDGGREDVVINAWAAFAGQQLRPALEPKALQYPTVVNVLDTVNIQTPLFCGALGTISPKWCAESCKA